ncbi:hypothetical protein BHM03_00002259 [Ensete ventricosum]|nr:hypothetical protein BHM03_00002259 [Ensete ventricosum]
MVRSNECRRRIARIRFWCYLYGDVILKGTAKNTTLATEPCSEDAALRIGAACSGMAFTRDWDDTPLVRGKVTRDSRVVLPRRSTKRNMYSSRPALLTTHVAERLDAVAPRGTRPRGCLSWPPPPPRYFRIGFTGHDHVSVMSGWAPPSLPSPHGHGGWHRGFLVPCCALATTGLLLSYASFHLCSLSSSTSSDPWFLVYIGSYSPYGKRSKSDAKEFGDAGPLKTLKRIMQCLRAPLSDLSVLERQRPRVEWQQQGEEQSDYQPYDADYCMQSLLPVETAFRALHSCGGGVENENHGNVHGSNDCFSNAWPDIASGMHCPVVGAAASVEETSVNASSSSSSSRKRKSENTRRSKINPTCKPGSISMIGMSSELLDQAYLQLGSLQHDMFMDSPALLLRPDVNPPAAVSDTSLGSCLNVTPPFTMFTAFKHIEITRSTLIMFVSGDISGQWVFGLEYKPAERVRCGIPARKRDSPPLSIIAR